MGAKITKNLDWPLRFALDPDSAWISCGWLVFYFFASDWKARCCM
jgi:hypothetical protein